MSAETGLEIEAVQSIEAAVRPADIVTIATSGASFPRIETEWLKPGGLVIFTGDADMEAAAFADHTVIADNWKMHIGNREAL